MLKRGVRLWGLFFAVVFSLGWPRLVEGTEPPLQPQSETSLRITEKEIIERLARLEEGQKSIIREMNMRFAAVDRRFEDMDKRFQALEKRLDQLGDIFIGIVAAFAAIVAVTIGFAIWDRRTALRPYVERHWALVQREEKVERALKAYAQRHPDLAEILRQEGLL